MWQNCQNNLGQSNMELFIDTLASDKRNPGEWDPKAVYDKLPEIQGMVTLCFLIPHAYYFIQNIIEN